MNIPLAGKILLMDYSLLGETLAQIRNPFETWFKKGIPRGVPGVDRHISPINHEHTWSIGSTSLDSRYPANLVIGSEINSGSGVSNTQIVSEIQGRELLHLVTSSPLMICVLVGFGVLLLVVFERRHMKEDEMEIEESNQTIVSEDHLVISLPSSSQTVSSKTHNYSENQNVLAETTHDHELHHQFFHKVTSASPSKELA